MKKLGCCTLCGMPVFDMDDRGLLPLEEARRVTLALADGSETDLTFCDGCEVGPEQMPAIHRAMLEAWAAEGEFGLTQVDNVPLGVIREEPWRDALRREGSHGRTDR